MSLKAALSWKSCTFGLTKKLSCTDSFIYKKTIELLNYTAMFGSFLFQMNRANSGNSINLILVGKCPLSAYRKEEIIYGQ